jgi:hypothetical protein
VAPMVVVAESGVNGRFFSWCIWQESDFSRSEYFFKFNLLYNFFYKFFTFNAICRDNAGINRVTLQYKKG